MRERQMLKLALALVVTCGLASASVVCYHVEPVKASWSGHTDTIPGRDTVAQSVTCNFDSLSYVELFAGDSGSTGSGYRVGVWEGGTELIHADGVQHQPTSWVRFDNWSDTVAFTKGKLYEFRFTRSGRDSIQYYYDSACGYGPYGQMIAPYPPLITPSTGLFAGCNRHPMSSAV